MCWDENDKEWGELMGDFDILAITSPGSIAAEAYRRLRTNILFSNADKETKIIAVTSAEPGEGKTTTAVNLAVVTAQAGYRTILLDCDLRKPSVHKFFKISNRYGISDLLIDSVNLKETAYSTEIGGLYFIPSGTKPPNPSELLASNKMKELIQRLKEQYDYIIIDTSPILLVTDAQLLSRYADGTLLVVSSRETDRVNAKRATELLKKVNAKILGVVINKVDSQNKFSTGYYKSYGSYLRDNSGKRKKEERLKNSKELKKNRWIVRYVARYNKKNAYEFVKRIMDILGSIFGLIITSPVLLATAIAIKIDSKGPVFFIQNRCGKDGRIFKMFKFRSMVQDAEEKIKDLKDKNEISGPVFKIKKDPRATRVGRFIRKTSIDELPQFINVLIGQMSLVGPRPPIDREYKEYTEYQKQRLLVKPGLTCYWQVSGRNSIDFDRWVELDLKYIRERNLLIDIKLIFKTFLVLFGDKNAY